MTSYANWICPMIWQPRRRAIMLVLVMLGLTLLFPLFLFIFGNPDKGPIISGYLGIFLQAAAFLSIGLWASLARLTVSLASLICPSSINRFALSSRART